MSPLAPVLALVSTKMIALGRKWRYVGRGIFPIELSDSRKFHFVLCIDH